MESVFLGPYNLRCHYIHSECLAWFEIWKGSQDSKTMWWVFCFQGWFKADLCHRGVGEGPQGIVPLVEIFQKDRNEIRPNWKNWEWNQTHWKHKLFLFHITIGLISILWRFVQVTQIFSERISYYPSIHIICWSSWYIIMLVQPPWPFDKFDQFYQSDQSDHFNQSDHFDWLKDWQDNIPSSLCFSLFLSHP